VETAAGQTIRRPGTEVYRVSTRGKKRDEKTFARRWGGVVTKKVESRTGRRAKTKEKEASKKDDRTCKKLLSGFYRGRTKDRYEADFQNGEGGEKTLASTVVKVKKKNRAVTVTIKKTEVAHPIRRTESRGGQFMHYNSGDVQPGVERRFATAKLTPI